MNIKAIISMFLPQILAAITPLFNNIHTILLLAGGGLIAFGLFLLSPIVGYIGAGVMLIALALLISRERG